MAGRVCRREGSHRALDTVERPHAPTAKLATSTCAWVSGYRWFWMAIQRLACMRMRVWRSPEIELTDCTLVEEWCLPAAAQTKLKDA